jgi:hypothetical protein
MFYKCNLIRGDRLFELKATLGFPLEIALDRIITQEGLAIDWVEFVERARKNLWTDQQIYRVVSQGLVDAEIDKNIQEGICSRLRTYMHPMANDAPPLLQGDSSRFDSCRVHQ